MPRPARPRPWRKTAARLRLLLHKARATLKPITGSKWARPALAAAGVVVALVLVRAQLKQITIASLVAAWAATPALSIALSVLFTALSFAALAIVEWEGLKAIGHPRKPTRVAIASLASNAISSVLGFGVVSGAAVRLRTYAFARLKPTQIARLVLLLQMATFVIGVVALGLSLSWRGARLATTDPNGWLTLAGAGAMLTPAALWFVLFRRRRTRGRPPWNLGDRLIALGAGLGDWLFSGAALFVLSAPSAAGFGSFMSLFCLGSLIGATVGVPGGLGVLEAVMIGLQASSRIHSTAAALILYRAIYFLGPLAVTLAGEAARRGVGLARPARKVLPSKTQA